MSGLYFIVSNVRANCWRQWPQDCVQLGGEERPSRWSRFSLCCRLFSTVVYSDTVLVTLFPLSLISSHLSLNREDRWGTTDDFATSFLHFPLFSTALWDLANSRSVHYLMLSSRLFLCLPCLLPPFTVPCKMVLARPVGRETWPYHCSWRLFTMVRRSLFPATVETWNDTSS